MTEASFGTDMSATEAIRDFVNKDPNSAFFTFESMIPNDIKCKVFFENKHSSLVLQSIVSYLFVR